MHVPTSPRGRGAAGDGRSVLSRRSMVADARDRAPVQHGPSCTGRHSLGSVQAHCPLGRLEHVPRSPIPSREGDEAVVPEQGAARRCESSERESLPPPRSLFSPDEGTEIQDPYRGPAATKAHGLPRRCGVGGHYEGDGLFLVRSRFLSFEWSKTDAVQDHQGRMGRAGRSSGGQTWSQLGPVMKLIECCAMLPRRSSPVSPSPPIDSRGSLGTKRQKCNGAKY